MRKHPLLAFAATTLSLTLGLSLTSAYGTTTRAVVHETTPFTKSSIFVDPHNVAASLLAHARTTSTQKRTHHRRATAAARAVLIVRRRPALVKARHTIAPAVTKTIAPVRMSPSALSERSWSMLRVCESDDNYRDNTGNGFYGAYQFSLASWRMIGQRGTPDAAPPAVQDAAARRLASLQGWRAWPVCSYEVGIRS